MSVQRRIWLLVPFLALPLLLRFILPYLGDSLARGVAILALPVPLSAASRSHDEAGIGDDIDDPSEPREVSLPIVRSGSSRGRVSPRTDAGTLDAAARGSLYIRASTVTRRLPTAAKTVRAKSVVLPDGTRGLELHGVLALRVGLKEGDVLVSLEGKPTPTQDVATSILTASIASHATAIHGTIVRGGGQVDVTVEVPTE